MGLLFPEVSTSPDSRIIYSDGTYRGVFRPSLFSNNDNKPLRDSKNSCFFKAHIRRRFTVHSRNKLLILRKKWFVYKDFEVQNDSYQRFPAVLKTSSAACLSRLHLRFLKIAFHSCKSGSLRCNVHHKCTYPKRQVDLSSKQSQRGKL